MFSQGKQLYFSSHYSIVLFLLDDELVVGISRIDVLKNTGRFLHTAHLFIRTKETIVRGTKEELITFVFKQ